MSYYNTTNITGESLKQAWADADTQEKKIMVLFMKYPETLFTPFEILNDVFPIGSVPVTSVRRALTNLTDAGKLIKTGVQKNGEYGKLCYCWKLNA